MNSTTALQHIFNFDRETLHGSNKYSDMRKTDSPLFTLVEKEFNDWMDYTKLFTNDYEEMYFSDEAIYTKQGAILGGIEMIFDVMDEEKLQYIKLSDSRLDFAAIFQG